MRTSQTDPLYVAEVGPDLGVTFSPGKYDGGRWDRDLDAIRAWGATTLVTLIEDFEFDLLRLRELPAKALANFEWHHWPIRDGEVPDDTFEETWATVASNLHRGRVVVDCRGGLGRAGTIAARLLVERGMEPEVAIRQVRAGRPKEIENWEQVGCVLGLGVGAAPSHGSPNPFWSNSSRRKGSCSWKLQRGSSMSTRPTSP